MDILKYRSKHRKCKYCEHHRYLLPPSPNSTGDSWCRAKLKCVNDEIPRPFCKVFKVEEDE